MQFIMCYQQTNVEPVQEECFVPAMVPEEYFYWVWLWWHRTYLQKQMCFPATASLIFNSIIINYIFSGYFLSLSYSTSVYQQS